MLKRRLCLVIHGFDAQLQGANRARPTFRSDV
jgi:hypothetical protein